MRDIRQIPVGEIEFDDTRFLMTFIPQLDPLVQSIKMVGLLEPLLVRERSDGMYQIVCGFKRVEALNCLSIAQTEAIVYGQDELTELDALLVTVGHNIVRPLNVIEKARALEKLLSLGMAEKEVIDKYLPLFGLQPNKRVLKRVVGLLRLERGLQEYVVRKELSLAAAVLLLDIDREGQEALVSFFNEFKPGENRVKEIVTSLREISLRDNISIGSLLATEEIGRIRADKELPTPQRLESLRKCLKMIRYPRLSEMEKRFTSVKRSLCFPAQIAFHPPSFFEGDQFMMELKFRDFRELQQLVTRVSQMVEKEVERDPLQELSGCR